MTNELDPDKTPVELGVKPLPTPLTHGQREALFGRFEFHAEPMPGDPERIRILGDWADKNIMAVPLPKIGPGLVKNARVHRLIAKQFAAFWAAVEAQGLLSLALTFDGAYVARFKRGRGGPGADSSHLSNHSWGTAFDINAPWNHLGTRGARLGEPGSTRRLVPLAIKYGFLNGAQFHEPWQDAMHFEAFKVV